jgi:predicted DNA-binding transcriptional regulator AlpA
MARVRHRLLFGDGGCHPTVNGGPLNTKIATLSDQQKGVGGPLTRLAFSNDEAVDEAARADGRKGRRVSTLPPSLPPLGLSREQATEYLGIGATTFDRAIADGLFPRPLRIYGRVLWDREKLTEAFRKLDGADNADDPDGQMAL